MILVSASSTARTTARQSGSENPNLAVSSPTAFRTTQSISGLLRNSILSSKLPWLTRARSSVLRNWISPLGLGKVAPGGFPDVTYAQIIHGILLAATCKLDRDESLRGRTEGCETIEKLAGGPVSRILRTIFASSRPPATCRKQRTLKF